MSTEIEQLNKQDKEILLRAPSLVAISAAISDDGKVSKQEKAQSIKLAQLRTYTAHPILHNYYKEVDKVFAEYFEEILADLPEDWKGKEVYIKEKLIAINEVIPKLNEVYARHLVSSLKSFARHVFNSNSSFLEYFILPIFLDQIEKKSFNTGIKDLE